jgi:hypothetical protein
MRSLSFITLSSLGLALATVAAPSAGAQSRSQVLVCRDGTRRYSDDVRACARHRGLDVRATQDARRDDDRRTADRRGNGRDRDDRQGYDPRYDDRRSGDPRYDGRDDRRGNGQYGNGQYDNGYGLGRNAVYEWVGTVDREIHIQLRGNRAFVQPASGEMRSGRGRVVNGLPQRNGTLVVQRLDGRGDVDVIQQPNARNGYTATVRVRDPKGGADNYRIVAYWQPNGGDDRYDDRRYGRN